MSRPLAARAAVDAAEDGGGPRNPRSRHPSSRPPAAGAHVDPAVAATVAAVLRRSGDCRRRGPAMAVTDVSFGLLGAVALWTGWRVLHTAAMVRASDRKSAWQGKSVAVLLNPG